MTKAEPVTWDDLDAILNTPTHETQRPEWLAAICTGGTLPDLDYADLLEVASEIDPAGLEATITGMLDALRLRHAGDRVTLAMLAALQDYHLPMLRDELRGV